MAVIPIAITTFFQRQIRGINDGSLAARLIADILQFEGMRRNSGKANAEREMAKRSHGVS